MQYGKIIIDSITPEVDRVFDYRIPSHLQGKLCAGHRVMVPFGFRNKKTEGYVLGLSDETDVPMNRIKEVLEVLDGGQVLFTPEMLRLAQWMKVRYFCTLSQCLQTIMPTGIRTKSTWMLYPTEAFYDAQLTGTEALVGELLLESPQGVPLKEVVQVLGKTTEHTVNAMEGKGLLVREQNIQRSEFKKEKRYLACNEEHPQFQEVLAKAEREERLLGQRRLLGILMRQGETSVEELKAQDIGDAPMKTLLAKGILVERRMGEKRGVFDVADFLPTTSFRPTEEQQRVFSALDLEDSKQEKRPVLLHGVTGSGKTEIYLQQIAKVLERGQQAIVLVPEISLTPQIMERFISRFGSAVSITHSRLSQGERLDQWKKARDGEISVMIGPRSALFMPFADLGMIIMDEIHESSYISDVTPKYDAREVAEQLAKDTGALLLMGSATPDLGAYHKAVTGQYLLLEMKKRTAGGALPQIEIVDMRQELEAGNRSPFSQVLQGQIRENLEKKEQTILFLNRRGFATFVSCRSCGFVMKCPDCDVAYTYHAKENRLQCHYCGRSAENPDLCPACSSKYIRYFGTGTQKIEEEAKRLFPTASILRMDLDTTTAKGSHGRMLALFGRGEADILIGTQMIAKGHDFPNVTLVGIMAADTSLNTGSYVAGETTFSLITQVGGRAGRSEKSGRVFLQTYEPSHYAIRYGAQQDYTGFYKEESMLREMMGYPPFGTLFSVLISGASEEAAKEGAEQLLEILEKNNVERAFCIMGPTPAMIAKFRGEYRQRMMIQGMEEEKVIAFVLDGVEEVKKVRKKDLHFNLTLNPRYIV